MNKYTIILTLGIFAFACNPTVQNEDPIDKDVIKKEVLKVMNAYKDAILFSDINALKRHYLDDPEFTFYSNNKFYDYEGMLKNMEKEFSEFTFKGDIFKDLQVNVLCKDYAIFYSLTDFTVIDKSSDTTKLTGGLTYILVKRDDTWKIIHGIGAHKIQDN